MVQYFQKYLGHESHFVCFVCFVLIWFLFLFFFFFFTVVVFVWKCLTFYVDTTKLLHKVFTFLGNWIWNINGKLFLLSAEYSLSVVNSVEDKKAKGTKKCIIKTKLIIQDYKNCLQASLIKNKINHLEKK